MATSRAGSHLPQHRAPEAGRDADSANADVLILGSTDSDSDRIAGADRIDAVCPGIIDTLMVSDVIAKGELDRAVTEVARPVSRLGATEDRPGRFATVQPQGQLRNRRLRHFES
ncbi:hypothetical protein [Streptomyces sp. NPDC001933]|uniref:hypothetical protein n=1 Tax=Streptomyces sp. NPDC001933 TaxID=3364626 RepID=UPI0036B5AECC